MEFPAPPSPPSSPPLQPPPSPSIKIGVHVQICNEPPWRMSWRVVEIPLSHLSSCMAHDCRYYCRHDHTHRGDPDRFRRAVSRVICISEDEAIDDLYGPCVVLGSKLYNFDHDNNKGQGHLFALDISHHRNHHHYHHHSAASTWTRVPIPTNYSHLSTRFPPVMVAVSGKLCLLGVKFSPSIPPPTGGVETFGLVYDPSAAEEHNRWCEIQEPEQKKIKDSNNIVALSLGDSVGQILVVANPHPLYVHPKKHCKYKLSYDVGKKVWNTVTAEELLKLIQVVAGKVVTVEDETTLYAVDKDGFFCAYNWNDGDLASGSIVGLEGERILHNLRESQSKVPLIRLGRDLFCLPWEDYDCMSNITHLHYSIALVKRHDDNPYQLTLFVVGCFCESFPGVVNLQDAFLL